MSDIAFELFNDLSQGEDVNISHIQKLLIEKVSENQFLEYKSGKLIERKKEAAQEIRKMVSGFANSTGGILIIGIDDKTMSIEGISDIKSEEISNWISSCLHPIAIYLNPPPRISTIKVDNEILAIIFTGRSESLVPRIDSGKILYSFRIYSDTIDAPDYLISDLMLGRRKIPHLRFVDFINSNLRPGEGAKNESYLDITLNIELENDSLLDIETFIFGVITYSRNDRNTIKVGQYIKNYLVINELSDEYSGFGLRELFYNQIYVGLKPFEVKNYTVTTEISLPAGKGYYSIDPYKWDFAFYLAPQGISPTWYQGEMEINSELLVSIGKGKLFRHSNEMGMSLIQLSGERPIIDIRKL